MEDDLIIFISRPKYYDKGIDDLNFSSSNEDNLNILKNERRPHFFQMEDSLNIFQMEDNLNIFISRPQYDDKWKTTSILFFKRKTTSIFWKMKDT